MVQLSTIRTDDGQKSGIESVLVLVSTSWLMGSPLRMVLRGGRHSGARTAAGLSMSQKAFHFNNQWSHVGTLCPGAFYCALEWEIIREHQMNLISLVGLAKKLGCGCVSTLRRQHMNTLCDFFFPSCFMYFFYCVKNIIHI